jgi:hypothetical protein
VALPTGNHNAAIGFGLLDRCSHIAERLHVDQWADKGVCIERAAHAQIVVRLADALAYFVNA